MNSIKKLSQKYNVRYLRFFIFYALLSVIFAIASTYITKTMGGISNSAVNSNLAILRSMLLLMAVFSGIKAVADTLRTYFTGRLAANSGYKMRKDFAGSFVYAFFKDVSKKSSGDMLSVFSNDIVGAVGLLSAEFLFIADGIIMLVVSAIFMFSIHPLLSLIFFVLFPPLIFLQIKVAAPLQPLAAKSTEARGHFNNVVNDSLQNTSVVLSYGLQEQMEQRYLESYDEYYSIEKSYIKIHLRLITGGILASFIPIIFITIGSGLAAVNGTIDLGGFIVLTALAGSASDMLFMLSQNLNSVQRQKAGAQRLLENTPEITQKQAAALPEKLNTTAKTTPFASKCAMRLKNVCFAYEQGGANVLDNINLDIKDGSNIAFVGKSGCGKSTLAKLILGLYTPDTGQILRAEQCSAQTESGICKSIAYVPQDSFLFPDTIKQNIICSENSEQADEQHLVASAKAAGIHNFIESLPQKYETMLADRAENLSGGQKQRIAIARALYSRRPVLMLDEATSALDASTEKAVLSEIEKTCGKKTLITVAHRLAAVENCDVIYLMENGKITESGSYAELAQEGTKFYELYQSQQNENTSTPQNTKSSKENNDD